MNTVIIRIIDLPHSVNGITVKDADGDYNVYINARLSDDQRKLAFKHEITHIKKDHLCSPERSVCEMEEEARR